MLCGLINIKTENTTGVKTSMCGAVFSKGFEPTQAIGGLAPKSGC